MRISVVACGAGRMGSTVIEAISKDTRFSLLAVVERSDFPGIGGKMCGAPVVASPELPGLLSSNRGSVLVDFTNPATSVENAKSAVSNGCDLVIGTTGFTDEHARAIEATVREAKVSAVVSPNFSIGINVFWRACEQLAKQLPDADIEIIEWHHKGKKDAPSGTAVRTAELIAAQTGIGSFVHGRKGLQSRGREIGLHAVRGGDIVGEHTVLFAREGERIELTHRAHSRLAFAGGCVRSIEWVHGRGDGMVHSLYDMLGM
jgi:4-hydroxy-tetrahydrodipicolinate reductase